MQGRIGSGRCLGSLRKEGFRECKEGRVVEEGSGLVSVIKDQYWPK